MKFFVLLAVFSIIVFADGQGIPIKKCPPGEHSVLYCPRMAEADCDIPTVHELNRPGACDIPDCFCNKPTVRDLSTGRCVKLDNCPKNKSKN